ncbi:hypothetical protein J8I87_06515 [Paraburkholderia sp. LEh10]|jgi:hypothetical protein|uniref:hypothetical protein n=1 Tax=Paraburkholderia sp. LEh10 TaxID=2821353 RepID=UPI001AE30768|nr:hypothetical protein [Paraburkholderia sp. LEh10]MBP0589377.1 hypothetical protein [Paraburkholderia sp. LEh10]
MHFLLLSTLPHTREARAHYDAFLSLNKDRRRVFATLARTLDQIVARLSRRSAV